MDANDKRQKRKGEALFYHGLAYWDGFCKDGVLQEPDYEESIRNLEKAAEEYSHSRAQCYLGIAYMYALGVPRNDQKAMDWFRKAADQDHAEAQFYMGIACMHALCMPKDDPKAVDWFRKAAEQDHPGAQNNLGIMYSEGWGIESDRKEAIKLFIQAERNGNEDATVNLGVMYLQNPELMSSGKRTPHNLLHPYRCSNARARYYYWRTLQEGASERKEWMERAAELGNQQATYLLRCKEAEVAEAEGDIYDVIDPFTGLGHTDFDQFSVSEVKCYQNRRYINYYYQRIEKEMLGMELEMEPDYLYERQQETKWEAERQIRTQSDADKLVSCILDKASVLDMEEAILEQFIVAVLKATDNFHKHELLEHFWQAVDERYARKKTGKEEEDAIYEYYSALKSLIMRNISEADRRFGKVEKRLEKEVADSKSSGDLRQKIAYWRGFMNLQEQALDKARECFERAAKAGLAEAQYKIGVMYLDGIGGEKEPRNAKDWLLRAAEQGYSRAACRLGLMYFHGQGEISRDHHQAKKWFEEAKISAPDNSTHFVQELSDIIEHRLSSEHYYRTARINGAVLISVILHLSLIYLSDDTDKAKRTFDEMVEFIHPNYYPDGVHAEAIIEWIWILIKDPEDNNCMKWLEETRQRDPSGKRSVLDWLLCICEIEGDGELINKTRELLARHVNFPIHFMKKSAEPHQLHRSWLLIRWLLIAANGDRKIREVAVKLLAEHDSSVERFIWHHIWMNKYFVSFGGFKRWDLLRALADSHDDMEGGEYNTAIYQYYYALSALFWNRTDAIRYFDLTLEKLSLLLEKFRNNRSIDKSLKKGQDTLQKKAENLRLKVLYWLGHIYLRGDIQEANHEITKQEALVKAREYFEKAAMARLAEAVYEIGVMYRDGIGGERELKKAERWFVLAAKNGNPRAAYRLGLMYFCGQDEVTQNDLAAAKYFKESLTKNPEVKYPEDLEAKRNRGELIECDLAEIGCIYNAGAWGYTEWHPMIFRDICWREQADSLAHLGFIYLNKDIQKARDYFKKAARACHAGAMINLGLISLKDDDRNGAIEWFEKAWGGDLELPEPGGPEGRCQHTYRSEGCRGKVASDLHHFVLAEIKLTEKYYLCNNEHLLKLRPDGDWWPRYRGNWLALHHLEILYRCNGDKEKATRCRERLEMTGFTMPDYLKRT